MQTTESVIQNQICRGKILLRYIRREKKKDSHFSVVLCFKIVKSHKNQGASVQQLELRFALILAPGVYFPPSIFALSLLCKEVV